MPRYSAYVELQDPAGAYCDLELVIEAADPRQAATRAFELVGVHPDEEFPQLLIVPEDQVHVYTRDNQGRAVTTDEDLPRLLARGPGTVVIRFDGYELERPRGE